MGQSAKSWLPCVKSGMSVYHYMAVELTVARCSPGVGINFITYITVLISVVIPLRLWLPFLEVTKHL
jgi:hypothetical protein